MHTRACENSLPSWCVSSRELTLRARVYFAGIAKIRDYLQSTLSRKSPSFLGPCLGQIIFNDDIRATLYPARHCLGQTHRNYIYTRSCSAQRGQKPYPVQWHVPTQATQGLGNQQCYICLRLVKINLKIMETRTSASSRAGKPMRVTSWKRVKFIEGQPVTSKTSLVS